MKMWQQGFIQTRLQLWQLGRERDPAQRSARLAGFAAAACVTEEQLSGWLRTTKPLRPSLATTCEPAALVEAALRELGEQAPAAVHLTSRHSRRLRGDGETLAALVHAVLGCALRAAAHTTEVRLECDDAERRDTPYVVIRARLVGSVTQPSRLGLALLQKVARRHGGRLELEERDDLSLALSLPASLSPSRYLPQHARIVHIPSEYRY